MAIDLIITAFITLWAVIDPIGTVPVFIHATKGWPAQEKYTIVPDGHAPLGIVILTLDFRTDRPFTAFTHFTQSCSALDVERSKLDVL